MNPHKLNHIISLKAGLGFKHGVISGVRTTDSRAMRNASLRRIAAQINNITLDADRKARTVKTPAEIQTTNILFWKKK